MVVLIVFLLIVSTFFTAVAIYLIKALSRYETLDDNFFWVSVFTAIIITLDLLSIGSALILIAGSSLPGC